MPRVAKLGLLVYGGLVLVLGAWVLYVNRDEYDSSKNVYREMAADTNRKRAEIGATVSRMRDAEKITDRRERRLQYPDLPSIHWDSALVTALCRVNSFQIVTIEEIERLLAAGDAAAVDGVFDEYLLQNFSDPIKHGILIRAYSQVFEANSTRIKAVVDHWVRAAPKSANALVARGVFTVNAAFEARGSASSSNTPQASFKGMESRLARGIADLNQALRINPRMTVAAAYLVYANRGAGDYATIENAAKQALAVDPTDELVYLYWMNAAEPRWSGSLEQVHAIVEASRPYRDRNPLLKLLDARELWIELTASNLPLRKADYDRVLDLAPDPHALAGATETLRGTDGLLYISELLRFEPSVEFYMIRSKLLAERNDKELAKRDAAMALILPNVGSANPAQFANALAAADKPDEAATVYRQILERNPRDRPALTELIQLDMRSLNRRDEAETLSDRLAVLYPNDRFTWGLAAYVAKDVNVEKFCAAIRKDRELAGPNEPTLNDSGQCANNMLQPSMDGAKQ